MVYRDDDDVTEDPVYSSHYKKFDIGRYLQMQYSEDIMILQKTDNIVLCFLYEPLGLIHDSKNLFT